MHFLLVSTEKNKFPENFCEKNLKEKNCHRGSTMSFVEGVVVNTVRGAAIGSIAKLMDMHTYRGRNLKRFA